MSVSEISQSGWSFFSGPPRPALSFQDELIHLLVALYSLRCPSRMSVDVVHLLLGISSLRCPSGMKVSMLGA